MDRKSIPPFVVQAGTQTVFAVEEVMLHDVYLMGPTSSAVVRKAYEGTKAAMLGRVFGPGKITFGGGVRHLGSREERLPEKLPSGGVSKPGVTVTISVRENERLYRGAVINPDGSFSLLESATQGATLGNLLDVQLLLDETKSVECSFSYEKGPGKSRRPVYKPDVLRTLGSGADMRRADDVLKLYLSRVNNVDSAMAVADLMDSWGDQEIPGGWTRMWLEPRECQVHQTPSSISVGAVEFKLQFASERSSSAWSAEYLRSVEAKCVPESAEKRGHPFALLRRVAVAQEIVRFLHGRGKRLPRGQPARVHADPCELLLPKEEAVRFVCNVEWTATTKFVAVADIDPEFFTLVEFDPSGRPRGVKFHDQIDLARVGAAPSETFALLLDFSGGILLKTHPPRQISREQEARIAQLESEAVAAKLAYKNGICETKLAALDFLPTKSALVTKAFIFLTAGGDKGGIEPLDLIVKRRKRTKAGDFVEGYLLDLWNCPSSEFSPEGMAASAVITTIDVVSPKRGAYAKGANVAYRYVVAQTYALEEERKTYIANAIKQGVDERMAELFYLLDKYPYLLH